MLGVLDRLRLDEFAGELRRVRPADLFESVHCGARLARVVIVDALNILEEHAIRPEGLSKKQRALVGSAAAETHAASRDVGREEARQYQHQRRHKELLKPLRAERAGL